MAIQNFNTNNSTWVPPYDSLVWIVANQSVSGICTVYFCEYGGVVLASISNTNGSGGLTYTAFAVVCGGEKYKILLTGYSACIVYYSPLSHNI